MSQATHRMLLRIRFESVGKRRLDESGKHPVNRQGEGNSGRVNTGTRVFVIASEAKQSISPRNG
jgi:hypothetical protein